MRLRRPSRLIAYSRQSAQAALLLLFVGTLTLSVGLNLLLSITGITQIIDDVAANQTTTALSNYGMIISILVYGLITPFVEELVFRGMFYSGIYAYARQHRFVTAAIVSSLLFGIYHMNLAQGIYAFVMGMAFCLAYELTGQFLSPWILHGACNIISLLLSQSVNGTNAFTQICTLPWTAAFLAIAIASMITLKKVLAR